MIHAAIEGGILWIILSVAFALGWIAHAWIRGFHRCVDEVSYNEMLDRLQTFLALDEGRLLHGPLFFDSVQDVVTRALLNRDYNDS